MRLMIIFFSFLVFIYSCYSFHKKEENTYCITTESYFKIADGVELDGFVLDINDSSKTLNDVFKNKRYSEILIKGLIINENITRKVYYNGIKNNKISLYFPTHLYNNYDENTLNDDLLKVKLSIIIDGDTINIFNCK